MVITEAVHSTSPPIIVASQLTKVFHPLRLRLRSLRPIHRQEPVCALRDLDLTVRRGEILGLLGTNGAGKTTLLKILATLILPTAGRVTVEGYDVDSQADQVKALIGLGVCEERSFYWRLTGRQNLEFFAAFHGLNPDAAQSRIQQLSEQLGLEALDRGFGVYSTGMRHRLGIARALLRQPRILLLDEPTRSLDPLAAEELRRLVQDTLVRQMGCTVVLATHNLQEAEELCDRVAILHQGRLAGCGTINELRGWSGHQAYSLVNVFERLTARSEVA